MSVTIVFQAPKQHRLLYRDAAGVPFEIFGGKPAQVPNHVAEALLTDPTVEVIEAPEVKGAPSGRKIDVAAAAAADPAALDRLKRAELDALALNAGVEAPEDLPNKDAVIEAIVAADESEAAEGGEGQSKPTQQEE